MAIPNEDKINSTISGLFETNNYFNVEETVSIFDKGAKDKSKPKKRVEIVLEELEEKIKMERNQREQLLDQLQLMDVRIDRYDQLIIDIDKEIQPLLDPINDAIDACKVAYDARVTNGCRNALKWVPIGWEDDDGDPIITYQAQRNALQTIKYIEQRDSSIVEEKVGLTDPGTIVKGYYGVKFYRKPLNRDYGSNLVDTIRGDVSAGSCGVSDIFSNINTWKVEDLNHIGSPVICPKNHCTCGTDVIIPKTRKNEQFEIIKKEDIDES